MEFSGTGTPPHQWLLFHVGVAGLGIASGIHETSLNNWVSEVHKLDPVARSDLEFPSEFPGFATVFLVAALFFLSGTRVAAVAIGQFGLAYAGARWYLPIFVDGAKNGKGAARCEEGGLSLKI